MTAALIGRRHNAALWFVPLSWRRRWVQAGGRIMRAATDVEISAASRADGAGVKPVLLALLAPRPPEASESPSCLPMHVVVADVPPVVEPAARRRRG